MASRMNRCQAVQPRRPALALEVAGAVNAGAAVGALCVIVWYALPLRGRRPARRELQHKQACPDTTNEDLVAALATLCAYGYDVPIAAVQPGAAARCGDGGLGCVSRPPAATRPARNLQAQRTVLVRGYSVLRAAVGNPTT